MSVIITKPMLDNLVRCQYYFSLEMMGSLDAGEEVLGKKLNAAIKSSSRKLIQEDVSEAKNSIRFIKDYVSKVAYSEMSGKSDKVPLHEYRMAYTSEFSKKFLKNMTVENVRIIDTLNNMFNVFASNIFLGYNLPIEIPISKTDIIYRDIVDFALTTSDGDIVVVELDNLSSELHRRKYFEWPHYIIPYIFLANSLEKDLTVMVIDPINPSNNISLAYSYGKFNSIYEQLCEFVKPIKNTNLIVRNLYACSDCKYQKFCEENVEWKI